MRFRVGFTLPGPPAPGSAWDFWHTHAAIDHVACAVPRHAQVAEHTLRRPRAPPNMRDALLFRPPSLRVSKFLWLLFY